MISPSDTISYRHSASGRSCRQTASSFLPRLWAVRRVGFLLDEIRLRGESKEVKDEVVTLAKAYGIVTPYTSYLILEDERSRGPRTASRPRRWGP